MNASSAPNVASGCSICGRCPAWLMTVNCACGELVRTGSDVTMPEVARRALVSEATAYRYFPDLTSLLAETIDGLWPRPAEALQPVASSADPVERVRFACEFLLRGVLSYQGAVRAMISGTITRPGLAPVRPGIRFGLIDHALGPFGGGADLARRGSGKPGPFGIKCR
jgi:AcrR family transcriptional regulator